MSASAVTESAKLAFAAAPWRERAEEALIPPLVALLVALICGDLLILSYGQSPAAVYRLLLEGTWGNAYGFGQVLYKATTLAFTGLADRFRASRISDRWPSCRLPMVGTKTVRNWPRNWSRRSSIEEMIFMMAFRLGRHAVRSQDNDVQLGV